MHTFADRLRTVMQQRKLGFTAIARGVGVSRQTVYNWVERDRITQRNLTGLAAFLRVDPRWLQYGLTSDGADAPGTVEASADEERLHLALSTVNLTVWELSAASGQVRWAHNAEQVTGLAQEQLPRDARALAEWLAPDRPQELAAILASLLAQGGSRRIDCVVEQEGGSRRFDGSIAARQDEQRQVVALVGTLQDTTALASPGAAAQPLADGFEFAPVGYVALDEAGCIRAINPRGSDLLGIAAITALDRPLSLFLRDDDNVPFLRHLRATFASGRRQTVRVGARHQEGRELLFESLAQPDRALCWTAFYDTAAVVDPACAARDQGGVGMFVTDSSGRFVWANDPLVRLLGYSREELEALSLASLDAELDDQGFRRQWQAVKVRNHVRRRTRLRQRAGTDLPAELSLSYLSCDGREYNCCTVSACTGGERVAAGDAAARIGYFEQ